MSPDDRRQFLWFLAGAFHTRDRIYGVLEDIGFPRGRWPSHFACAMDAWRTILRELEDGAIENGILTLLKLILEMYKANKTLQRLAARYAPELVNDQIGSPGPPSAHEPVDGHVFISYVREDSAKVDRLQQILEAAGAPVWRDTTALRPGQDWKTQIRRAINEDARVFVACFSRYYLARDKTYINEELSLAIDQMRRRRPDRTWLIPARFDHFEIPDLDIGAGRTLASIQHADLFGDNFDTEAAKLTAAILQILRSA